MIEIRTTIEQMLDHSVSLNGLLIPISAVDSVLSRYAECLFLQNNDQTYPVSLNGSGTALRYRGKYLMVCSRHQLRGHDPQSVAILTKDGKSAFTSGGVRHFREEYNEVDLHDIAVFDFTEPCNAVVSLKERFFAFSHSPVNSPVDDIVFVLAAGFPFSMQDYDLGENNHLGLGKKIVACRPANQPSDPTLLTLQPVEPLDFDPNGMSGGSAFSVQILNGTPTAFFAGIIVRAGRNYIHIVKSGYVRRFMDQCLDLPVGA